MSHTESFEQRHPHYRPLILQGSMDALSSWTAWFMIELCKQSHRSGNAFCTSLPTGGTPAAIYRMMGTGLRGDLPFKAEDRFLALDNYHLPQNDPNGYDTEIVEVLHSWGLHRNQLIRLPYRWNLEEQRRELASFDENLALMTIDLQGLGIGDDGHIAFCLRPSKPIDRETLLDTGTELVELDVTVRAANARFFNHDIGKVPRRALTRGLKSILNSKWIWILANNIVKANPIYTAFTGAVGPHCPASYLQLHPRVVVLVADEAAGPFLSDPRVRHKLPNIEELIESESCGAYLDRC